MGDLDFAALRLCIADAEGRPWDFFAKRGTVDCPNCGAEFHYTLTRNGRLFTGCADRDCLRFTALVRVDA